MEIKLRKGETLRISFRDTEQLFEITETETEVLIIQLSGWELRPLDDNNGEEDERLIFRADRC